MATQSAKRARPSSSSRSPNYDAQYGTIQNRQKYQNRTKTTVRAWSAASFGYLGYQGVRLYKANQGFKKHTGTTIGKTIKRDWPARQANLKLNQAARRSALQRRSSIRKHKSFERYYSARSTRQRAGMHLTAARLKFGGTRSLNRASRSLTGRPRTIDLRSSTRGQRYRHAAILGGAALGGAAVAYGGVKLYNKAIVHAANKKAGIPAHINRSRRVRRDSKGRFAGSY